MIRAFAICCLLAAPCLGAVDTLQEQLSVMDVGAPWRGLRVDPDATMNSDKQAALLDQYGFAGAAAVADMVNVTTRQVYTTLITNAGITDSPLDTTALQAYIESLTVNPEVDDYDWSGTSIFSYRSGAASDKLSNSRPATLISDTHAIASDHNGPNVGDVCYFRTPAGGMASGTVAAFTEIAGSAGECRLVRFTANPDATLKRYPICTDASLIDYAAGGGALWCIQQEQKIRLRVVHHLSSVGVYHQDSVWVNAIENGSGRPGFVPITNGELVITGTIWWNSPPYIVNNRTSAVLSAIQTQMDSYSETLTTYSLPDPNYSDGTGDGEYTGYSIFHGHIFGRGRD